MITENLSQSVHARELADETLQSLMEFCQILEVVCTEVSDAAPTPYFFAEFSKLIDGISTFTDGISAVKRVLKLEAGAIPVIDGMETQLMTILHSLLSSQEKRDVPALSDTLKIRLRENLQNWREVALPALVRARDC